MTATMRGGGLGRRVLFDPIPLHQDSAIEQAAWEVSTSPGWMRSEYRASRYPTPQGGPLAVRQRARSASRFTAAGPLAWSPVGEVVPELCRRAEAWQVALLRRADVARTRVRRYGAW